MLDKNCVFCRIVRGELPSSKVYEDDRMIVFKDLEPKAKTHLLAVPKDHFKLLEEVDDWRVRVLAHMLVEIPGIAKANGCDNGYRLIVNQGDDANQTVHHLHIHILGGEKLPD